MSEIWKAIDGYKNYQVSSYGNVKNTHTNRLLKPLGNKNGYQYISLCKGAKPKFYLLHRLVALTFLENPEKKRCVDHINKQKRNNNVSNLRFATHSENAQNVSARRSKKLSSIYKGVAHHKASNKFIAYINLNGIRYNLGYYRNEIDAGKAYNTKALELFGQYANLNIIDI